jgi:hypothetical protein
LPLLQSEGWITDGAAMEVVALIREKERAKWEVL